MCARMRVFDASGARLSRAISMPTLDCTSEKESPSLTSVGSSSHICRLGIASSPCSAR